MRQFLLLLLFSLAACQPRRLEGPPDIRFGRDTCARCGMIVSEQRFASGYIARDGKNVAYDDYEELLEALAADPTLSFHAYVNDLLESGWIRATEAHYVRTPGLTTPMGSGIAAFRTLEQAKSFAKQRSGEGPFSLDDARRAFKE